MNSNIIQAASGDRAGPRAGIAAVVLLVGLIGGCATNPLEGVTNLAKADPTAPYIGRSKSEIVACAGAPYGRYRTTTGENLIYHYSGAGPVPGGAGKPKAKAKAEAPFGIKKSSKNWDCSATFAFTGETLARINYAPREVEGRYTEDGRVKTNLPSCSFTLPNCPAG